VRDTGVYMSGTNSPEPDPQGRIATSRKMAESPAERHQRRQREAMRGIKVPRFLQPVQRLRRRIRRRVRRSRTLDVTWRGGTFVIGALFILAGLVMIVTPGPGWMAIILGLAILATEFAWAHRALIWTRDRAREASARALDPRTRRRNLGIALGVLVLAVAGAWLWVDAFGWPAPLNSTVEWVRSWR